MPWTLDDAEKLAADWPDSFFIPPAELRHSLRLNDTVKLIFRLERDDGEVSVERMWVDVVDTGPYVGALLNEPALSGVVPIGERVTFGPEHVCAYAYDVEELGYHAETSCRLLARVAQADTRPPLLVCRGGGEWEAHAEDETDDEFGDASNVKRWTLGYLTDKHPEAALALREGTASPSNEDRWWRWDGERYVRAGG